MKNTHKLFLAAIFALPLFLTACQEDESDVEEAMEETGEAVEDAADNVKDGIEDAANN